MYESTIKGRTGEWWAHYGGNFDFLHLFSAARRLNWNMEATFAGGSGVISAKFWPRGADATTPLVTKDLFRIIPDKLKNIANGFELPSRKLFTDDDYSIDMREQPKEKVRDGCIADCKIVLEALDVVEELLAHYNGTLKSTFSSSALTCVMQSLKQNGLKFPQHREGLSYATANKLAVHGYYGARVEVFNHAPPNELTEYDVASSYPWSASQVLPWNWIATLTDERSATKVYDSATEGMVRARVNVPKKLNIPPLPYRSKTGGLFFPTGNWEAWFPAVELRYAQSLGVDIEVKEFIAYTTETPFKDFITKLYQEKKEATGPMRPFLKFLLNGGCYGKFAESPERERLYVAGSEAEAWHYAATHEGVDFMDEDNDPRLLKVSFTKYSRHVHYAIGSYITANSRILLHRRMLEAEGLAYVDTDSVHATLWNGQTSNELGALKVELANFIGRYYGPKIYSLHDTNGTILKNEKGTPYIACKGFPKSVEGFNAMLESAREYRKALIEEPTIKLADKRRTSKSVKIVRTRLMKRQARAGPTAEVLREVTHRSWKGLSVKRKPHKNGTTTPWDVKDILEETHRKATCPIL
jgi:hypothetical protein